MGYESKEIEEYFIKLVLYHHYTTLFVSYGFTYQFLSKIPDPQGSFINRHGYTYFFVNYIDKSYLNFLMKPKNYGLISSRGPSDSQGGPL